VTRDAVCVRVFTTGRHHMMYAHARDVSLLGVAEVAVDGGVGHTLAVASPGAFRHVPAAVVARLAAVARLGAHILEPRLALARKLVGARSRKADGVFVAVLEGALVFVALEFAATDVVGAAALQRRELVVALAAASAGDRESAVCRGTRHDTRVSKREREKGKSALERKGVAPGAHLCSRSSSCLPC
jgi:hypothetical protein